MRIMEKSGLFEDFDDKAVYDQSQARALNNLTHNFIVEFGKERAQIVFDLGSKDVKALLNAERDPARPIRWM